MDDLSQQVFLNYIGGEWVACASGVTAPNLNPADTSDVVGRFQQSDADDAARAVAVSTAMRCGLASGPEKSGGKPSARPSSRAGSRAGSPSARSPSALPPR